MLKTLFNHITKHLEVGQKYSTKHCILNSLPVFGNLVKQDLSCLINYLQ